MPAIVAVRHSKIMALIHQDARLLQSPGQRGGYLAVRNANHEAPVPSSMVDVDP